MEEKDHHKELQLLPTRHQYSRPSSSRMAPSWPSDPSKKKFRPSIIPDPLFESPSSLDLQLSISLRPLKPPSLPNYPSHNTNIPIMPQHVTANNGVEVEALKWQAAEQIRLAAMEKAYAERVRELTRREMELAHSEFARARHTWERAREEVEKAERMKEMATRGVVDSVCMEITCQSCRQRFRP